MNLGLNLDLRPYCAGTLPARVAPGSSGSKRADSGIDYVLSFAKAATTRNPCSTVQIEKAGKRYEYRT